VRITSRFGGRTEADQEQRAGGFLMLLSGLLGAVLSASSSLAAKFAVARRWRCLSKPSPRAIFAGQVCRGRNGTDGVELCEHDRRAAGQPHGV